MRAAVERKAGACRRRVVFAGILFAAMLSNPVMDVWAQQAAQAPVSGPAVAVGDAQGIRAQLLPRQFTTLAAEIGAKVNRLPVAEGAAFRRDDLLVTFDCSTQTAQLQKAEAALVAAEKTWIANQRLLELNAIGRLELDVADAERQKNQAEVATMRSVVAKCTVPAPFAGRIAEQKVREQQFVQPGQTLLEILDDSVLELEFIVPSRWLTWMKPKHAFRIRIDETGKTYPARVQRVGAKVDPVSQTVKVHAEIEGNFPELIAGMSGRASFANANAR